MAFKKMDDNHDGSISTKEFHNALKSVGLKLTNREIEAMFEAGDTNNDEFLSFHEFCTVLELARTFKGTKQWENAYDLFIGESAISNAKSGFLRDEDIDIAGASTYDPLALYQANDVYTLWLCGPSTCGIGNKWKFGSMARCQMCCLNSETVARCIEANTCCKSVGRMCCIDHRGAFPPDNTAPCEIGVCGLMCKSAQRNDGTNREALIVGDAADVKCKTALCCTACGLYTGDHMCSIARSASCCCVESSTRFGFTPTELMSVLCNVHHQSCCCDSRFFVPCGNDGTIWKWGCCETIIWQTDKPMWVLGGVAALATVFPGVGLRSAPTLLQMTRL